MNLLKSLKRIVILLLAFLVLYNSYCILTYAAQDEEDITTQLSSKEYTIDNKGGVIKRILPETTIKSFKANFSVPENDITIYTDSSCSKEVVDGFVVSGMILKAKDIETKFQICIIGDLDNDGKMGEVELNKLINHVAGLSENKLTGLSAISADINGDGNIDQIDITILIRWVVDRVLDIPEMKLPQAPNVEVISGEKGENDWYKSNVKVKISNKKDLGAEISKLTYKLDEQEEKEITDNSIIELSENGIHNITVYTYSKEGVKNNTTRKIKIDKVNPKEAVISLNKNEEITGNTIVANVIQEDNESEISLENSKWIYNTTKDNLGINNEIWNTANTFNNTNELNLVANKKGTYYLHILSVDKAGNKTEKTSEAINIRQLVNQISLNKNSTNIMYKMTEKLTAVVHPSDADNQNLVWTSSNENIATVSQDGQINAIALGETTITVRAQDESNVSATCTVVVTSKQISNNFSITLPNETYTYDGTEKTPELTVKDGETVLVKDTDYTVSYQNNTNAGSATATVTGINNYAGTTSINFTINKAENPLTVTNPSTIYVQSSVDLADNVSNNQGTVSYSVKSTNETTPGRLNSSTYTAGTLSTSDDSDATVVITVTAAGNGNYNPKSSDITITVQKYTPTLSWTSTTPDSIIYNATGKSAIVSASTVGGTLGTITYSSSNTDVLTINASTGALTTVSGTGSSIITANIARTSTVKAASTTKAINAAKDTNPTSVRTNTNLVYTGSALNLVTASNVQGTVYYSTTTSLNSDNYQTSGSNNIPTATNVGEYTVYYYITENTNYNSASGNVTATITSKSIEQSNFSVTLPNETYTYDETEKTPELTIKDGETVLVKDTDYTVSYQNNTNAGTATATVTGINNYAGTTSINFTINKAENPLTVTNPSTIYVQSSVDLADNVSNNQGTVSYSVKSTSETTPGSLNSSTYTAGTLSTSDDSDATVVITVTAAGNGNYNPKSSDITITVQKYTPTLSWTSTTPDSITYNATGKRATVSVSTEGGSAGVVTYSSSNTSVLTINASTGTLTTVSGTGSSIITANIARTSTVKAASITKTINLTKTTNPTVISSIPNLVYTGSALNLVTASNVQGTVYYSTITSLNSSNYQTNGITNIPTATNVGDYTVYYYVTGNTNYDVKSGNVTVSITSRSIEQSDFSVTLLNENYTYDGTSKMPALTVKDGITVLVKDVDYMVFYEDNVDAGTATATVTGINNYAGTTSINFTIDRAENPLTVDSSVAIFVQYPIDLANSVHNSQGTVSYSVKSTNETTSGSLNSSIYTSGTLSTSDDSNGEVVITVTAAGNRNYRPKSMDIPISVQKYTPTLNWTSTTPDSVTYNTTGKSATVSASTMGGTVGTITYSSSNTGVLTINASTGALTTVSGTGSSTITANVARTSTVKAASTTKTISAAKATNPASISGNTSLVHTGSALNLVTASNVQGTVYYSTTTSLNSSNYQTSGSTTIPTATSVGNYTVYYYVTGNTNYNAKSGNVKATIKAAIAQINTTRYSSLQSAVNAVSTAQAATVVKLLENTEENVTISTGKNVNINLNGKNVTSNSRKPTFKVSGNNATLKISGTGEITKASQGTVIEAADGGNINITSGKISANDWTAIESSGSGSFKMSGGTIELALDESNGNYRRLIELANTGGTYIAGGTLKNTNHMRSYSAYLCGGGVLEVTDVTSIGKFWIDNENYSSVNIKGGTYTANPYWGDGDEDALVIHNYDGKVATISRRNI